MVCYQSLTLRSSEFPLQALVRYIHLNPLRAKIVAGLKGLGGYPYCGHGLVLSLRKGHWQDVDHVLPL